MKVASEKAYMQSGFLRGQRVRLNYQPVINFTEHSVYCVEALLNWQSLTENHISNEGFIAELEDNPGLALSLDSFVITTATKDWHTLKLEHGYKGLMSVNVSPSSLQQRAFVDHVKDLVTFGTDQNVPTIDADKLILEITERQRWQQPERVWLHINELAALGVKIAVDDFMTGYANFNAILNDVVSIVKLDKSVTDRIMTNNNAAIFVEQFAELTRNLNKTVIIEGVEEYEQADWLSSEIGYNLFQGYFFAVPTDLDGMVRYLKAQRIYRR